MSINWAIFLDQDPYMYRFDYLKTIPSVFILSNILLRLRLRISNRGCSIPDADLNRLLLKLNV